MSTVYVYLGPSIPAELARSVLPGAVFRPPVRRGDAAPWASGDVVAMIDGVFDQDLSVSPQELGAAFARGVVIFGGASMGALRAAEVPGVRGIGRVYAWYRDGVITKDDEVALLFDPTTGEAVTVPTVNVRFAVERLCSLGTIDRGLGRRLVEVASSLPYRDRTYRHILDGAGLTGVAHDGLLEMLQSHDLKRQDAQDVLEAVDQYLRQTPSGAAADPREAGDPPAVCASPAGDQDRREPGPHHPDPGGVHIWESGDTATPEELAEFLIVTGQFDRYARQAAWRLSSAPPADLPTDAAGALQSRFVSAASQWGWQTREETQVTLNDLGLTLDGLGEALTTELTQTHTIRALREADPAAFHRALLDALFVDDIALKRLALRVGALRSLADRGDPPGEHDHRDAAAVLCRANRVFTVAELKRGWAARGLDAAAGGAAIHRVARARAGMHTFLEGVRAPAAPSSPPEPIHVGDFHLIRSPKPVDEPRFTSDLTDAQARCEAIRERIGVTRVGLIGELAELGGIQIAQACRPDGGWSSSYGSGKSTTREGAIVGSVLEETEKWAQQVFEPADQGPHTAFAPVRGDPAYVDPASLDLPYDTIYAPELPLRWHPCVDLLSEGLAYLPVDVLTMHRGANDIQYTRRGARKHLATNGLGCGFTLAEAVLHAMCEYVERHAQRLAELRICNPGGLGPVPYRFVDPLGVGGRIAELHAALTGSTSIVRVLDITCEVAIPTFLATVTRDRRRADGYGTHPNPRVAMEMALLEAAQTIASATAGGREDLTIRARSLGRHERPRPVRAQDAWLWSDPDAAQHDLAHRPGHAADDVLGDVIWCLERVRAAGCRRLVVADLTPSTLEEAHVVRVLIPGLETNNPFYTGPRARMTLLSDLLPSLAAP